MPRIDQSTSPPIRTRSRSPIFLSFYAIRTRNRTRNYATLLPAGTDSLRVQFRYRFQPLPPVHRKAKKRKSMDIFSTTSSADRRYRSSGPHQCSSSEISSAGSFCPTSLTCKFSSVFANSSLRAYSTMIFQCRTKGNRFSSMLCMDVLGIVSTLAPTYVSFLVIRFFQGFFFTVSYRWSLDYLAKETTEIQSSKVGLDRAAKIPDTARPTNPGTVRKQIGPGLIGLGRYKEAFPYNVEHKAFLPCTFLPTYLPYPEQETWAPGFTSRKMVVPRILSEFTNSYVGFQKNQMSF